MAACQVNIVVPVSCVQQSALVLVDARNRRPLPVVEDTRSIHKNVAVVVHNLPALEVLDLHIVAALCFIPSRAGNLVPCLDELVQSVLAGEVVEVSEDLFGASIDCRPIKLGLEGPGVIV